jgi:hypothetical protein
MSGSRVPVGQGRCVGAKLIDRGASAQKLTRDSIEPKSLPSANLAAAANAAAHGVRAASSDSHGH